MSMKHAKLQGENFFLNCLITIEPVWTGQFEPRLTALCT